MDFGLLQIQHPLKKLGPIVKKHLLLQKRKRMVKDKLQKQAYRNKK